MKYTKEQLSKMSDFEVNKLLAEMLQPESEVARSFSGSDEITIAGGGFAKIMINYCKNPNDIMPLASEYKINIIFIDADSERCRCEAGGNTYGRFQDKNPLRAIACCLILLLQVKGA